MKILMIGKTGDLKLIKIANELHVMNHQVTILMENPNDKFNFITDKKLFKSLTDLTDEDVKSFNVIVKINQFVEEEIKQHNFLIDLVKNTQTKIVFNSHVGSLLLNDSMAVLFQDVTNEKGLTEEEKTKAKISTEIINLYRKQELNWSALAEPQFLTQNKRTTSIEFIEEIFKSNHDNCSELGLSTYCYAFAVNVLSDNNKKQLLALEKIKQVEQTESKLDKIINELKELKSKAEKQAEIVEDKLEDLKLQAAEKLKELKKTKDK